MTATAADFLRRRSGWSYFRLQKAEDNREAVLSLMSEVFGWDAVQRERQTHRVDELFRHIYELPSSDGAMEQDGDSGTVRTAIAR